MGQLRLLRLTLPVQRVFALAAGIWHNNKIGASVTRSLIAYDH
jgi:hypothetical protein